MPLGRPLISWTRNGLYCEAGDFYIDPHRGVKNAVVTHAHSDHARRGSEQYYCTSSSVGLMKVRLGKNIQVQGIPYRQKFQLGPVTLSFHSAGHILGSAQVRVQYQGEVWVASGDYKREPDPSCDPFESVPCNTFITEATFGTPKYTWKKTTNDNSGGHGKLIYDWWQSNARAGFNSLLFGYSLGKAQRILAELAPWAQTPILIHDTIIELAECYRKEGRALAPTQALSEIQANQLLQGELVLAPPSILESDWNRRLGHYKTAFASGWMQGSANFRMRNYDHGFVISDHADWNDLNLTIRESGASRVFVQHRNGALVRHLRQQGIEAYPVEALNVEEFERIPEKNLELF